MQISVIASGSNGNSTLIEHKNTSILIDAGKSIKETELRLNKLGKSLENLNGIILSHAHIDHYLSAGAISRRFNTPLYLTKETHELCKYKLGQCETKHFDVNIGFKINDIAIEPIKTSHDVPSCGFKINKFGIFTDTGHITPEIKQVIKKLNGIILESNYDVDMLINGRYPYYLKQRILSNEGHLSNFDACEFIKEHANHLDFVLLGHLSGNNNTPKIAKQTFETIVKNKIEFQTLSRDKESGVWEL